MKMIDWQKEFQAAITVCDRKGIIVYMNDKAQKTFEKYGGGKLVGKNLLDCHPEPAKTKLKKMLVKATTNSYTIEKGGVKKLIHQSPWYRGGEHQGIVEISIEIPLEMPHFIRDKQ